MRIGIDISTLLNHGSDIGAGRYIMNLLKNILIIDKKDTFILTARYFTDKHLSVLDEIKKVATSDKIEYRLFKTSPWALDIWNKLNFPPIEMLRFSSDIIHCPDFMIPSTLNRRIILTINDLAFMRYPEFNFEYFVKEYKRKVTRNATVSKSIIAISKSTRNDIIEYLDVDPKKVNVTYLAADDTFRKLPADKINYSILEKYDIKSRFILSVGTVEPRKNYVRLIRCFNRLKAYNISFSHQLVIVGRTGWKSEATYQEYKDSPFKKDIIFLGRIPDSELLHIYNLADIFVFPSIFEGFGFPVVEAMQCGLPVLASNSSSIPEIITNRQQLFNPEDEKEMADKINTVIKDDRLRKELSEKASREIAKFSWMETARQTLKIYKNTFNHGKNSLC